jgi:hypothetical protein
MPTSEKQRGMSVNNAFKSPLDFGREKHTYISARLLQVLLLSAQLLLALDIFEDDDIRSKKRGQPKGPFLLIAQPRYLVPLNHVLYFLILILQNHLAFSVTPSYILRPLCT